MQEEQRPQDFVQRRWPWLIVSLCACSLVVALAFRQTSQLWTVYALATLWTAWTILAYARGKSFHVSPGLSAQADDSILRRRVLLGTAICLHFGFTVAAIYGHLHEIR
ncbi:hypothetical protein [Comamonas testosteroni]|uniref:hypothetical protein n=1 Tax=Comamonas testosteroni TaxID=285 RepID=UPI0015FBCB91|nr:hypothetical protein [Comamonas testosteroni]WEE78732.1 hypothetical protein LZ683_04900 [Comamonas testosteroni]